jgi:hypothetical protein
MIQFQNYLLQELEKLNHQNFFVLQVLWVQQKLQEQLELDPLAKQVLHQEQ